MDGTLLLLFLLVKLILEYLSLLELGIARLPTKELIGLLRTHAPRRAFEFLLGHLLLQTLRGGVFEPLDRRVVLRTPSRVPQRRVPGAFDWAFPGRRKLRFGPPFDYRLLQLGERALSLLSLSEVSDQPFDHVLVRRR